MQLNYLEATAEEHSNFIKVNIFVMIHIHEKKDTYFYLG